MLTLLAFLLAIVVLVFVHEYGHYRAALACGVGVLRFSIGFGTVLWRRVDRRGTEWVVSAVPLGGYVRMLDEREAPVPPHLQAMAFNRQSLTRRNVIVLAGPLANLGLAVLLYAVIAWIGPLEPVARLASPPPGSVAAQAGVEGGETVVASWPEAPDAADGGEAAREPVRSWNEFSLRLIEAMLRGETLQLAVQAPGRASERELQVDFSRMQQLGEVTPRSIAQLGFALYTGPALVAGLSPDGVARAAGMQVGDVVEQVNGQPVLHGEQLVRITHANPGTPLAFVVRRGARQLNLTMTPASVKDADGKTIGLIGAEVGSRPERVRVQRGFVQGLRYGVATTWDFSALTLRMLGRMVMGEASLKNISGPVSIAGAAGNAAQSGWLSYLSFLAVVSVSLGVLNLLPLPVLDGGQLMYHAAEFALRRPLSEKTMMRLQQLGIACLGLLMAVALFNDLARLISG